MKKKTVPAILIHLDWIETIKCLSHEQIGAFIIAMLDYANTGKGKGRQQQPVLIG